MEPSLWRAHGWTRWLHHRDLYSIDTPSSIIVREILFFFYLPNGIFFLLKLWNFTLLFYPLFYCWGGGDSRKGVSVKFSTGCCHKLFPLCVPSVFWWQMTSLVSCDSKFTCHVSHILDVKYLFLQQGHMILLAHTVWCWFWWVYMTQNTCSMTKCECWHSQASVSFNRLKLQNHNAGRNILLYHIWRLPEYQNLTKKITNPPWPLIWPLGE